MFRKKKISEPKDSENILSEYIYDQINLGLEQQKERSLPWRIYIFQVRNTIAMLITNKKGQIKNIKAILSKFSYMYFTN